MEKQKISITRALSEIKLLDSKIESAIQKFEPVTYVEGKSKTTSTGITVELFNEKAKSSYQSITDLIERRNLIKSRVIQSNAVTKVSIDNKEYTVAEAIERKNSINNELNLLNKLKQSYVNNKNKVEIGNSKVRANIDKQLELLAGSDKNKTEGIDALVKLTLENQQFNLVDELKSEELIDKLSNSIYEFQANVDFTLSESNALTTIEV